MSIENTLTQAKSTRILLLTGLHGWGRTTLLEHLFKQPKGSRFPKPVSLRINSRSLDFGVISQSNDDLGWKSFKEQVLRKQVGQPGLDLFCAFCPSTQTEVFSLKFLRQQPFNQYTDIHVILLETRWDQLAKLQKPAIETLLCEDARIHLHVVRAYPTASQGEEVRNILAKIYGGRSTRPRRFRKLATQALLKKVAMQTTPMVPNDPRVVSV